MPCFALFQGVIMKFFTKLLLAVLLLVPAVAEAEQIEAISFNPSRLGWYRQVKVVSYLSFTPKLEVENLIMGADDVTTALVLPTNTQSAVEARFIYPDEETTGQTIDFYRRTALFNTPIQISGGDLYVKEGEVNKIAFPDAPAKTYIPVYAASTKAIVKNGEEQKLTVAGNNTGYKVGVFTGSMEKAAPSFYTLKGFVLGPNEIPVPPAGAAGKCYKWKTIKKVGTTTLTEDMEVLTLSSSNC